METHVHAVATPAFLVECGVAALLQQVLIEWGATINHLALGFMSTMCETVNVNADDKTDPAVDNDEDMCGSGGCTAHALCVGQ